MHEVENLLRFQNAKTWNYNLYDFETGNEIELENGTVRIKFLDDDGTEAEYGRGHVSS